MKEKTSIALQWGADLDLIKGELYGNMPLWMLEEVSKLGMTSGMEKLAIAMLCHRYSPKRRVPEIKELARIIAYSRRHVYGMLKIMQTAGLVVCEKVGRTYSISISGLVERLRSIHKAKDAAKPAEKLASRPAPQPKEEPAEDELTTLLNERESARNCRDLYRVGSGDWSRHNREFKRLDDLYTQALKRQRKKNRPGFWAGLAVAALGGG